MMRWKHLKRPSTASRKSPLRENAAPETVTLAQLLRDPDTIRAELAKIAEIA